MNRLARIEKLEQQIRPATTIRFTMDEREIDETIPGVIWVLFAIEASQAGIVSIQPSN